uniref:Uncharacterized protein n=1 Tax=Timema tahoe TaxID=61484 RepID=A0A7R9NZW1_9NEOP|nr:unnamed protein product [Timema tahoe]
MERLWKKNMAANEKKSKKASLLHVIIKMFFWQFMMYGILTFIVSCVFRVIQPLLLAKVIQYFDVNSTITKTEAYLYAGSLVASTFISSMLYSHTNFGVISISTRIRVACCSLMYRKILRLSKTATGHTTTGQVVNLLSNDVSRFDKVLIFLHYVWIMPFQTVLLTYFIWQFVGISALVGVGALFLQTVPVQGYLGKLTSKLRLKVALRTDERVRLMSEIISGIQVIKMYAWEKPFEKMVALARKHEIDVVKQASYLRGVYFSAMVFSERMTLFLTLLSYVLLGNHITPEKVFSLAQFYNIMQLTMAIFYPQAIQFAAEAKVSIKRLEDFLSLEETVAVTERTGHSKMGITISGVSASWEDNSITDTLSQINLNVQPDQLCVVIGPVGAGKSSLLQAILKELPLSKGTITASSEVSYASQEPWLFVGTVRQNILFGQPYNPKRYNEVVKVCALKRDFELFPNGDKTVVGERGVSLSGGQRARINLARAVYRESDVYLLDDPLSAVDTHVGKHLFEECITSYLRGKARILVTHQLQHIKYADHIVILNNGLIEVQGTYNELTASNINFAALLNSEPAEENTEKATLQNLSRQTSHMSRQTSHDSTQSIVDEENEDNEPDENTELLTTGSMKMSLYAKYFKMGGGACLLLMLVLSLIIGQSASSGSDYWVTFWTNQEQLRKHHANLNTLEDQPMNVLAWNTTPFPGAKNTELDNSSGINVYNTLTNMSSVPLPGDNQDAISPLSIFFFKVCMNASIGLHDTMFRSILQGTMRFFDTNPSGRVLNRFSKDMGAIDELLPILMLEVIQIFLVMSGILTMVSIVNYMLIIPMLCVAPLYYKIRSIYLCTAQDIKRLEGVTRSPVFSHVSASFSGLTTIRASGAQEMLRKEFDSHQDLHTSAWYLTIAATIAFGFWLDCISNVFVGCITLSFLVFEEGMLGADVGLAISQSLILSGMLQYGIRQTAEVVNQMTAVERVLEYTKIDKEQGINSESDPPVLRDLNFVIEPAQKVGIVGRTGAGKSSLISALFRLAKLEGSIKIDQVDTQTVRLHDLRSRISIIPQEPVLFSASLRDNLDPFRNYQDDTLWNALEEVELKDSVESLSHKVNAGGTNFSAGQRQLVCLARAIVRNSKVLVLDEATANVDPQTDTLIQGTIRRKFADCTVLTIAHRLNTVMDSDKVLVMDAGTMVEFGHPYELLQNQGGYFYSMVQETGKSTAEQLYQIAQQAYAQDVSIEDSDKKQESQKQS